MNMPAMKIDPKQHQNETAICVYSADEAAKKLGRSVSSIRRDCRELGVKRIKGATVAGFVRWTTGRLPVDLPYSE